LIHVLIRMLLTNDLSALLGFPRERVASGRLLETAGS
jgi:hypothetical protein